MTTARVDGGYEGYQTGNITQTGDINILRNQSNLNQFISTGQTTSTNSTLDTSGYPVRGATVDDAAAQSSDWTRELAGGGITSI